MAAKPLRFSAPLCGVPAEGLPCDFLPFRGGAAAAAEGVVIYRLPCRAALFCAEKLSNRQYSRAKQVY